MSVYAASIDDNDSQVLYSDGWVLVTQDGDWTGTMHSTSVIGSTARVRFTGSRVAVVCTIPTGDGQLSQASFALDNGSAIKMSHATTPPVQWQTVFWDSGPLAFGSHLVVITNTGNNAYFRLDHIDYDPTSASSPSNSVGPGSTTTVKSTLISTVVVGTSPSSSAGSAASITPKLSQSGSESSTTSQIVSVSTEIIIHGSGSSSSTSSTTGTSSGPTIDAAASATAATSSSSRSSTSLAGIIAGILGGLLGILLLVLALLYIRRRRRRARELYLNTAGSSHMSHRSGNTTVPTPFSLHGAPSEMSNLNLRSNSSMISPYGANSFDATFDATSSPINSMSLSPSSSESSTMMGGQPGQHQFQHFGAATAASRSKRAEFMAEQQGQLVDTSIVSHSRGCSETIAPSTYQDQDAPPAYPGRV